MSSLLRGRCDWLQCHSRLANRSFLLAYFIYGGPDTGESRIKGDNRSRAAVLYRKVTSDKNSTTVRRSQYSIFLPLLELRKARRKAD
jgi:hypothetical protein